MNEGIERVVMMNEVQREVKQLIVDNRELFAQLGHHLATKYSLSEKEATEISLNLFNSTFHGMSIYELDDDKKSGFFYYREVEPDYNRKAEPVEPE